MVWVFLTALVVLVMLVLSPFIGYMVGKFVALGVLSALRSHERRFPFFNKGQDCHGKERQS